MQYEHLINLTQHRLEIRFKPEAGEAVGWELYDSATGRYLCSGWAVNVRTAFNGLGDAIKSMANEPNRGKDQLAGGGS